jgi:predicted PurR-regulated permease PerM
MDESVSYRTRPRHIARIVFAGGLVLVALWMTRGILVVLAWAMVLAVSTWPLYRRFRDLFGEQYGTLASFLFTLLAGAVLFSVMYLVLVEVSRDGSVVLQWIQQAQQSGVPVPGWVVRLPILGSYADSWWRLHLSNPRGVTDLFRGLDQESITAWTSSVGGQVLHRFFLMILTLIALFFLLRDGEWVGERLLVLANGWLGDPGERLAEKIVEAVRGTFNGTIVVAFGEGLLIGAAYVITGVPHAVLFGFLTILFALVPFGAWIAFSAASLTLLATTGSIVIPAGLFAFGSSVMLIGDNLVQPAIIGGAARLPFFWALLGIIGGLESLGLVGLFIGPVIMAALLTVWREWGDVSPRRRESTGEG